MPPSIKTKRNPVGFFRKNIKFPFKLCHTRFTRINLKINPNNIPQSILLLRYMVYNARHKPNKGKRHD